MRAGPDLFELLRDHPVEADRALVVLDATELTRPQLLGQVEQVAKALTDVGVRDGQPVAVIVSDGLRAVVDMFAVWAAGGVYVPLDSRLTDRETTELLAEVSPSAVVGTPAQLDRLSAHAVGPRRATCADSGQQVATCRDARTFERDVALAMRTSGTTGEPRTVLLRHSGTLDAIDAALAKIRGGPARRRPSRETPVNVIPLSLALWAGTFNTLFAMRAGATVVLMDTFEPERFAALVQHHKIRSTVLVPAMINMLSGCADLGDLSPLRFVRSITAPLLPSDARRFADRFGVVVLNSYGQTELGGEVVGWTAAEVREFGAQKLGAAGRPYAHIGLLIVDPYGDEVPAGAEGEIYVSSPFLMNSYADPGHGIDDRLVDGYLRTGDLGHVDESGFLWVHGRVSDMINRGGLKVSPTEVEAALRRHPDVLDVCVAGVPDARLGEVPFAWVQTRGSSSHSGLAGELTAHCRTELAAYKVPVGFTQVTDFPRNASGKVLRRVLVTEHDAQPVSAAQPPTAP